MTTSALRLGSLLLTFTLFATAQAQNQPAPGLEIPDVLKSAKATLADRKPVGLTLSVDSKTPLSAAQWDAIATLHARAFSFGGSSLDDADRKSTRLNSSHT